MIDLRRLSLSVEDGSFTISTLFNFVGDEDLSDPVVTTCDEYGEFSLELSLLCERLWRSPFVLSLVFALRLLPRTACSSESQSSTHATRGFLESEPIVMSQ